MTRLELTIKTYAFEHNCSLDKAVQVILPKIKTFDDLKLLLKEDRDDKQ